MGAQGGHEARPYSADDALTTYTAVQIRYRICAVDHLVLQVSNRPCIETGSKSALPRRELFTEYVAILMKSCNQPLTRPRKPGISGLWFALSVLRPLQAWPNQTRI